MHNESPRNTNNGMGIILYSTFAETFNLFSNNIRNIDDRKEYRKEIVKYEERKEEFKR
jgi:hypothetical protein